MANSYNHVFETPDFRYLSVDSATVIDIGDLLYWDADDVKPASDLAFGADEAATQDAFARAFAGVALQASAAGDNYPIKVGVSGIFEFDCANATFHVGDPVAPAKNATADHLDNSVLKAASGLAIGSVYRTVSGQTRVLVDIHSASVPNVLPAEQLAVFHYNAGAAIGSDDVTIAAFEFPSDVLITRLYVTCDQAPGAGETVTATITNGTTAKTATVSGSETTGSDTHVDQAYAADASMSVTLNQTAGGVTEWATVVLAYRPQRA